MFTQAPGSRGELLGCVVTVGGPQRPPALALARPSAPEPPEPGWLSARGQCGDVGGGACGSCISAPCPPLPGPAEPGWPPGLTKVQNRPPETQREPAREGPGGCGQGDLGPSAHRHTLFACWQLAVGWALGRQRARGGPALEGLGTCLVDGRLGHLSGGHRPTQPSPFSAQRSPKSLNPWTRTPTGASHPPAPTGGCRVWAATTPTPPVFVKCTGLGRFSRPPRALKPLPTRPPGTRLPSVSPCLWLLRGQPSPAHRVQLSLPCSRGTHGQASWAVCICVH